MKNILQLRLDNKPFSQQLPWPITEVSISVPGFTLFPRLAQQPGSGPKYRHGCHNCHPSSDCIYFASIYQKQADTEQVNITAPINKGGP